MFHIIRKSIPTDFPVTLKEVKSFLGIHNERDDDLLSNLISICSEYAQWYIEKSLSEQTWVLSYSGENIPKKINLPFGPLISVISVKGTKNDQESIIDSASYHVDILQSSMGFSEMLDVTKIEITYNSGYVDLKHIPMQVKYGILHHTAISYKNRNFIDVKHIAFLKEIYLPFREVRLFL